MEAALFIPMFLFAFMCIFSLISCVRAQVLIQYSVDQAAKEVAEYSYILEKTGVLDAYKGLNTKSEEFSKQMEDIKSNLEVIENTAKSVTNGQGTIQDVADAGKAGKATYDQLKEYKKNPKEFVNGVLNYVKNGSMEQACQLYDRSRCKILCEAAAECGFQEDRMQTNIWKNWEFPI